MKQLLAPVLMLAVGATTAPAQTYLEDFNAPGAAWESGWFGQNTDARNYYCGARDCGQRGNLPQGLWLDRANAMGSIVVNFLGTFGSTITSLVLDIHGWMPTNLRVTDSFGATIFDAAIALTTSYTATARHTVFSTTGISRFEFTSSGTAGNTGIDNVFVTAQAPEVVPEPLSMVLLATGLAGLAVVGRRRRGRA